MVSGVKNMYSLANKEEMYAMVSRVLAFENENPVDITLLRKSSIKALLMLKKENDGKIIKAPALYGR